ncbi:purine permease 3-like [Papaver somniferum]|uniref:purine permease 3-like n=1 Tax=Papaver somniferum TaxID=3469 RepID=UPI000E701C79|nr:purine permease 3-like [Papaver somniferum]
MSIDGNSVEEGGMTEKSNHNPPTKDDHEDSSSSKFLLCMCFFGTVSSSIGCLISKDFLAIQREASEFGLGAKSYYLVLVLNMVFWQLMLIGRVGIIFCTSSLFAGVMSAVFLPISQIAAVLTFHESFPAEKGMALVLTLWGFTSYFYGVYKTTRRLKSATMQ